MPGPARKPTVLKLVTGNPGRRPLNKREPKPQRVIPAAPDHLPAVARAAWARLAPVLDRMGVLTEADVFALERACTVYAEIAELEQLLAQLGRKTYITNNEAGMQMVRALPQVAMLADADRRLRGWLCEFGLTPASRSKVSTTGDADPDLASKYFD